LIWGVSVLSADSVNPLYSILVNPKILLILIQTIKEFSEWFFLQGLLFILLILNPILEEFADYYDHEAELFSNDKGKVFKPKIHDRGIT
jgi:hypothetical protein